MRKVICTLAVGEYNRCLNLARPTFSDYSLKYGYDYIEGLFDSRSLEFRPPSWGKVILLHSLLEDYDFAVWVDCDAMIIDNSCDIEDFIPEDKIQAVVNHHFEGEDVPTAGTWAVRREMRPYLSKIWSMYKYTEHPWWEQAALQELMGYEQDDNYLTPRPVKVRDTELAAVTQILGLEWASYTYQDLNTKANILHFPGGELSHRVEWMENGNII